MTDSSTTQENKFLKVLTSEAILGVLVALLSVFTALAGYQSAVIGAEAAGDEVQAIKLLTESNTEFLRAQQVVIYDYSLYDNYYVAEDEEASDYYEFSFSEELSNAMERPEGPFDDAYYDEMFRDADQLYDEALLLFDSGEEKGTREDAFQLVMLVFAVGLTFAGWASLLDDSSKVRIVFAGLAILTLIFGVLRYITI
ncbi:MAG: hypothetical protein GY832_43475 [Chloroflexi bacterium]|nr:hypothetical protein [Chloroflexota bacterium]